LSFGSRRKPSEGKSIKSGHAEEERIGHNEVEKRILLQIRSPSNPS